MEQELTREQVDARYTWDLTRIFADDGAWEAAFSAVKAQAEAFAALAGTLGAGREAVLAALRAMSALDRSFGDVMTYAMMKLHEDGTQGKYQAMNDRAMTLGSELAQKCAFLTPELLTLEESELEAMAADPAFADYDVFLRDVLRMKPHTLSVKEEKLLAAASELRALPESASDMLYIDLDLGTTRGEDGKKTKLTDARLLSFLSSRDRAVRKAAYVGAMKGYERMGNTFAALYAGQVKADLFASRARGYDSPRQMALYPDAVDESVYDSLIDAVHGGIGTLTEYLHIKQRRMGLPKLHLYDLYAEESVEFDVHLDFD